MLAPVGEMREVVRLREQVVTTDRSGGEKVAYIESPDFFVALRPLSPTESTKFNQVDAQVTYLAFGHYHDLKNVKATHRLQVVETKQEFDISGPPLHDPKRAYTRLNLVWRENAAG